MRRIAILIFLIPSFGFGQDNVNPLFAAEDILELQVKMDIGEVLKDREVRDEHPATLIYKDENDNDVVLDLKVSVRGITRAKTNVCKFPPLKLNFKKKQVEGTLFDGQNKLKLVTHCNSRPINEEYNLREYYVYKLYQLVSPFSLKVRLCKVTYVDTAGKEDDEEHYNFLIEDIDDLAERSNMKEYDGKVMNQDVCDRAELDKLTFFEYMIGNLDWSVPERHNFKLIYGDSFPAPVAVPYDFDFSGIVNTNYAKPPPDIDITSVRVRVFRGLCRQQGGYDVTADFYNEIKPQIYALYTQSPYLTEKYKDQTIKYLDQFYDVIADSKSIEKQFNEACRANHKHLYEY